MARQSAPPAPDDETLGRLLAEVCALTLPKIVHLRKHRPKRSPDAHERIVNVAELAFLSGFDLYTLGEDIAASRSHLRRNLYARIIILTVYETSLAMTRLITRQFRQDFCAALDDDTLDIELKRVHKRFHDLFAQCERDFGDVRDGLIAHRDPDAETRLRLLTKPSITAVQKLCYLAINVISDLWPPYTRFLESHTKSGSRTE